jgi:glutathione S-transferase
MKPLLAKKSDDELDEWLSTHPLEKSRKLFKGAARGPVNDEALEDARNQFNFVFERMDQALANGDWLCGNQFSLADIAFAPALDRLGQCDWLDLFDGYPRVMKWCGRIREREAYAKMRPQDAQRLSNLV